MTEPAVSSPIVAAERLSKIYRLSGLGALFAGGSDDRQERSSRSRSRDVAALTEISFEVGAGSALGVIGRNGAGKSSLLRILAGISPPSSGSAIVNGATGNLLDLGGGFIDELSGIENARLLLAISGLDRPRIEAAMEEARAFAGLGDFWRHPVRTYSSGMRLRLAYSLVAAMKPDILIADEILSVGDEAFQRRCSRHILRFVEDAGTLIFASHNLYQIERLCDQVLWLERGRTAALGRPREVTASYRAAIDARSLRASEQADIATAPGAAKVYIEGVDEGVMSGEERAGWIETDRPLTVRLLRERTGDEKLHVQIAKPDGTVIGYFPDPPRGLESLLRVARCELLPGPYLIRVMASERMIVEQPWQCRGERRELGNVLLRHAWG